MARGKYGSAERAHPSHDESMTWDITNERDYNLLYEYDLVTTHIICHKLNLCRDFPSLDIL
jgi:hypothetical protein